MTLGGAAQVAAAHCPNERTLDPAVCSYNRPTYCMPQPAALWPLPRKFLRQPLTVISSQYSQIVIASQYSCTSEGWKAELAISKRVVTFFVMVHLSFTERYK